MSGKLWIGLTYKKLQNFSRAPIPFCLAIYESSSQNSLAVGSVSNFSFNCSNVYVATHYVVLICNSLMTTWCLLYFIYIFCISYLLFFSFIFISWRLIYNILVVFVIHWVYFILLYVRHISFSRGQFKFLDVFLRFLYFCFKFWEFFLCC